MVEGRILESKELGRWQGSLESGRGEAFLRKKEVCRRLGLLGRE